MLRYSPFKLLTFTHGNSAELQLGPRCEHLKQLSRKAKSLLGNGCETRPLQRWVLRERSRKAQMNLANGGDEQVGNSNP